MASTTCCIGAPAFSVSSQLGQCLQHNSSSAPKCSTVLPLSSSFRPFLASCRSSEKSLFEPLRSVRSLNVSEKYLRQSRGTNLGRPQRAARKAIWIAAAGGSESSSGNLPAALLFDCDGVLVDTERDGHRIAFNETFKEKGLQTDWDVDTYGKLLEIGGGKERMTHHFNQVGWPSQIPSDEQGRKDFIAGMHKRKTDVFMKMVESGAMPLRPGVARLVDEAFAAGIPVAVCSTSNEKAVSAIVRVMLGPERASKIRIFAGDVVPKKKPDPAIYNLAAHELQVDPSRCVVIEDSHIGLSAAKAAGMTCVVTKSVYTRSEDFTKADAVYDSIGDAPSENFGLKDLANLLS